MNSRLATGKSSMKILSMFLIVAVAIFSISNIGSADRLYQWIDSEGVTHLSEKPPTESGKSVEIMEYSVRTNKPKETAQDQSGITPEKQREQINSEKLQETEAKPKPKNDLATACYIQAGKQNVYVYATEDLRPGGSSYQNTLWKGDILRGQKKLIKSSRGKIQFSYQRSSDERAYGRNQANCVNGNVITIP
jgi:hypothetical protein